MKHLYKLAVAAAMAFSVGIVKAQPCGSSFFDGFETGSYSPTWSMGTAPITFSVGTTAPAPAAGSYRLSGTGGNSSHLTGLSTTLASSTPSTISWYMYPNGNLACNYVVGGDNSVTATNCAFFCYWVGASGQIRFISSATAGYTPPVLNAWYYVEMRNINWTAHTFDIYINNTLVYTAFPFRSATVNSLTKLHLYNFNSGSTGYWDNISVGGVPITASSFASNVSCNGGNNGSASLTVSGGQSPYTYAWSNSATTQNVSGLIAGTYSVVITDAGGCHDTVSNISVTQPTAIASTIAPTNVDCYGNTSGSLDLTVSGGTPGYTYLWSSTATTQDVSGLGAATYTVIVTDNNGCTHVDSAAVTQPPLLLSTATSTDVLCSGNADGSATANPTGGSPAYSYMWSNGYTTQTISNVISGNYSYTVTDVNGCTTSGSTTINQPPPLTLNFTSSNLNCNNDSSGTVTATGGGGSLGYQYLWNTGATTSTINNLNAGVYYCTVTDSNSCSFMDSVTITEPTVILPVFTSFGITCNGDSTGTVGVAATGGTPSYTYLWNTGDTSSFVSSLPAGTYSCTITDNNGCVNNGTVTLTEPTALSLTLAASNVTTCGGNDGSIDLTVSGGTPAYSYAWSNSANTEDISALMAGSYSVTVTDANGCVATGNADINNPPSPTVSLQFVDASLCVNDGPFTLNAGSPAGGTWSGTAVTGNTFSPTTAGTGSFIITYNYTDNNGCSGTATDTLVVSPCVGIQEQTDAAAMSIYPNPTSGLVTVSYEHSGDVRVDVLDAIGQVIDSRMMTGSTMEIDLSAQPVGIYLVRFSSDSSFMLKKIVRR